MMDITYEPSALKALKKIPARDREALIEKIERFARGESLSPKIVKPFTPTTGRIRHGDWRAVYAVNEVSVTMLITAIGHRREIYE